MLELYTTVSSSILSLVALFLFVRLRRERAKLNEMKTESDRKDAIISGNLGGYYYWHAKDGREELSDNIFKMFNAYRNLKSLKNLANLFENDKEIIMRLFHDLKSGRKHTFLFNSKAKVSGEYHFFQCYGNKTNDHLGQTSGVLIWFYDTSEYITQIINLASQNRNLKIENEDLHSIVDTIPTPLWIRKNSSNIAYCNKAYENVIKQKIIYSNGNDEVEIKELDSNMKQLSRIAINNNKPFSMDKHIIVDGKRHFFQINEVKNEFDENVIGYAEDATHIEQLQQELDRHVSAHSDLLEISSSACAIYGADMRLRFYNNAFAKLWHLDESWLNSNPYYSEILEKLRQQRKLPEQADFKDFRDKQISLFQELMSPQNEFFHLPNGTVLRVIAIPHALGGLLFSYEDMTDKLDLERSYNTLIAVQKETLDNLREGIAVFGRDGILKLYNPMYTNMWPNTIPLLDSSPHHSDLVEHSKHLFDYGDDWQGFKADWLAQPTTTKPIHKRAVRTDGKIIDKMTVGLPDGAFLVSFHDITNNIQAQNILENRAKSLEETDKLKTEFMANISYELRTPLTSIIGFSEALKHDVDFIDSQKQHKNYVESISKASNYLLALIEDILDLSSIEMGCITLNKSTFNLHDSLISLHKNLQRKYPKHTIILECANDVSNIEADEIRIKQAMFNLVDNAVKFSSENSEIIIGARTNKTNTKIDLWVQDKGLGIKTKEKSQVFDKFFKTSTAILNNKQGVGLGLALVKNIIDLHGGKIKIDSEPNKGTKVICSLNLSGHKPF